MKIRNLFLIITAKYFLLRHFKPINNNIVIEDFNSRVGVKWAIHVSTWGKLTTQRTFQNFWFYYFNINFFFIRNRKSTLGVKWPIKKIIFLTIVQKKFTKNFSAAWAEKFQISKSEVKWATHVSTWGKLTTWRPAQIFFLF